ncbi:hypothetical protein M0G43_12780 [Subsaxibacter sp. CAU 1640]|uniref:hypothetical protein n=1 Tax=Subsaxibacter sp. CAU 1640 TaxID=2933271 RepID=UPI0020030328|nr:hypothetical protein [Subsaxibacter sp. CAU 1640]MCK7591454.1 hypothetical protein [Subsaxibacter sp. CAU 1640]
MSTYRKNGHKAFVKSQRKAKNGSKVAIDPVNAKLPWKNLLPKADSNPTAKESESATVEAAKKENPVAETTKEKKSPARYHETGFPINVENFARLRQIVIGLGDTYVQGNPLFTVESMETIYQAASESLLSVQTKKQDDNNAIAQMNIAFEDVKKLSTQSKNIFIVSGVPETAIKRCILLNHLVQGSRVEALPKDATDDHISASHQSRVQMIQHVDGLIELFTAYPQYNPPASISAAGWKVKRTAMYDTNQAGYVASTALKLERINRNLIIQKPVTGLVDVGQGVKKTILGIFGFNSPQFAMVKGIEFRKMKGWQNL